MKLNYEELIPADFAPDSRVWIYQSNRLFNLQEALQVEDMLKDFVETNGVEKCVKELSKMKAGSYVYAFLALTEFVKPKLARTEVTGDPDNPVQVNVSESLTYEQLYQLKYGHPPKNKK